MVSVFDVPADLMIGKAAAELEKNEKMKQPEWSYFVKTGVGRDRAPLQVNWWHLKAASILRTVYIRGGPVGVQRLRSKYGGRKNRGVKPEHLARAGGKIIRVILQQLEGCGYLSSRPKKGRIITSLGMSFLDGCAYAVSKDMAAMPGGRPARKVVFVEAVAKRPAKKEMPKKKEAAEGEEKEKKPSKKKESDEEKPEKKHGKKAGKEDSKE